MEQWATYDIVLPNNAAYSDSIEMVDETGSPIDLTGVFAQMTFRRTPDSTTADITLDSDAIGGIVIDAENGLIMFTVTIAQAKELTVGYNGGYDFLLTAAGDTDPTKIARGSVTVCRGETYAQDPV